MSLISATKIFEDYKNGRVKTSITSSRIKSKETGEFGKFVVRARLPKGKYLWRAFWMLPNASEWDGRPKSGENDDVMEYRGYKSTEICATVHFWKGPDPEHKYFVS